MATTATRKTRAYPQRSEHAAASKHETHSSHLSRHQRKCTICHHADREEIEQMFLHWFSASSIYRRFLLKDRSSIYDHAHATGLYARRRKNMRCALENIIERSDECPISSNGIVRAIKAYCSLTDAGEWIEPASRVVYISTSDSAGPDSSRAPAHATVPGTTVDGWNCRTGDVRSTVPSSSHATATSAPMGPTPPPVYPASDSAGPGVSRTQAQVYSTPRPSASHTTATGAPPLSNWYNKLLETGATHTKQRTGPDSNRYK